MLLLDGQVHHDTRVIPMGNYVSEVGNYVSASPSHLGNYVSADTQETETNITWAKETLEALHPDMDDRSYVNNLTADDGWLVHHVWGANYKRLVAAKRRYDPDNILRLNHNIDPSA